MCYISHWCSTPKRTLYFEHTCSTLSCRKHFKNVVLTSGVVSYHVSGHSTSRVKWALAVSRQVLSGIWSPATSYQTEYDHRQLCRLSHCSSKVAGEKCLESRLPCSIHILPLQKYIEDSRIFPKRRIYVSKLRLGSVNRHLHPPSPEVLTVKRIRGGAQNKSKYPEVHFAVVTITMIFLNWDKLNDLQLLWMRNGPITERTF